MEPSGSLPCSQQFLQLSLFSARCIQSLPSHTISLRWFNGRVFTPGSCKRSFPLCFPNQTVGSISLPRHMVCPSHYPLFFLIGRLMFGEGYNSRNPSLCSSLHSSGTLCLLEQNIFPSILFSSTFILMFLVNVTDQGLDATVDIDVTANK